MKCGSQLFWFTQNFEWIGLGNSFLVCQCFVGMTFRPVGKWHFVMEMSWNYQIWKVLVGGNGT